MAEVPLDPGLTPPVSTDDRRLDSWKEIAAHFNRAVRTVQLWERREGMPVHRHLHGKGGSVYAYRAELEAWWRNGHERLGAENDAGSPPPARSRQRRMAIAAAAGLGLVGLAVVLLLSHALEPNRARPVRGEALDSLAVLPFVNGTGDPDLDYLGDGLTVSLINSFAQLRRLRVVPRAQAFQYRGRTAEVEEVGRALNVRALVTGEVSRRGEDLVVTAELVDLADRSQLWGHQYDREERGVLSIQRDITRQVAAHLTPELTRAEQRRRLARGGTKSVEAYDLYVKGLYHWNRVNYEGMTEAVSYFQRAAEADPTFALPHEGLADVYGTIGYMGMEKPEVIWPLVKAEALKALALDEELAGAHAALGHATLRHDWDWPEARRSLDRALALDPRRAATYHWFSHYWSTVGNLDKSLEDARRAVELDPTDLLLRGHELYYLALARRTEDLLEARARAAELDPDFWLIHMAKGHALRSEGRLAEAIPAFEKANEATGGLSLTLQDLGYAYALAGRRSDAERIVEKLQRKARERGDTVWVSVAAIRVAMGQKDEAFEALERAYAERDTSLLYLRMVWWFDGLRDDPRFEDLVRRVGLPQGMRPRFVRPAAGTSWPRGSDWARESHP